MIKNAEAFKYIFDANILPIIHTDESKYTSNMVIIDTFENMLVCLFPNAKVEFLTVDDRSCYYTQYKYSVINKDKKYEFRFAPYTNHLIICAVEDFEDIYNQNISRIKKITLTNIKDYVTSKKASTLLPKHVKYKVGDLFVLHISNSKFNKPEIYKLINYIFTGNTRSNYRYKSRLFYVIKNMNTAQKYKAYEKTLNGKIFRGV